MRTLRAATMSPSAAPAPQIAARLASIVNAAPRAQPSQPAPAPVPRWALLLDADDRPVATVACDGEIGVVLLGRSERAAVRLTDASVSRRHATLRWDADLDAHVVTDLQSANGTCVNGQRVRGTRRVPAGATLSLGALTLRYQLA